MKENDPIVTNEVTHEQWFKVSTVIKPDGTVLTFINGVEVSNFNTEKIFK